jgi:hypothetical protein
VSDITVRVRSLSVIPVCSVADDELVMIKPTGESMVKHVKNYGRIYLPAFGYWTSYFSSADIHCKVEHFNCLLSDFVEVV